LTWLLLLWGLLPWLLSLFASSRSVTVHLPVSEAAGSLWTVTGRLDGTWLWLGGVHEEFARELGHMYADLPKDQLPFS